MNQNLKHYFLLLFVSIAIQSCQTNRTITPTISSIPRKELKLPRPIQISIKDSRENVKNREEVINSLQNSLQHIYGNNVVFRSYFDRTNESTVTIKLNIKEIGATFGTRTIHYRSVHNQTLAVSNSISNYWGTTVSTVILSQPIYKDNFIAEGYWIGTSYIEVEFVDNLNENKQIYRFPLIAEDRVSNTWGYKSASSAANKSWNILSSYLLDFIDSIATKIVESNN